MIVALALHPHSTLREVSNELGLTERTVYTLIKDLSGSDIVRVQRVGRRKYYVVNNEACLPNQLVGHLRLGTFLDALQKEQ